MKKKILALILSTLLSGCLSFNFGNGDGNVDNGNGDREIVLMANSNNVYRLSSDTILSVKVQNSKGKWVKAEHKVLIPEDWYIVNGKALD